MEKNHKHNPLGNNCKTGGFMLHCTASRIKSPWHNFVSNTEYWKTDTGAIPCENMGGIYPQNRDFLNRMKEHDAKNIFTNTKNVILVGSPPPILISELKEGGYWIPFEKSIAKSDIIIPKSSAVNVEDPQM